MNIQYLFERQIKKFSPRWLKFLILFVPRQLKLRTMGKVLKELEKRGIRIKKLDTIELFARGGDWHTMDYAPFVKSVEAWEIDPVYKDTLKRNLPNAKIVITDSIKKIKETKRKFDFIISDNPEGVYGKNDEYCEHFDIFSDIFRLIDEKGIVMVNVFPKLNKNVLRGNIRLEEIIKKGWLERRKKFYNTVNPADISLHKMLGVYRKIIKSNGFELEWYFLQRRNAIVYYLVLGVKKVETEI